MFTASRAHRLIAPTLALLALSAGVDCPAAVSVTGQVSPSNLASNLSQPATTIEVGIDSPENSDDTDPRAVVRIEDEPSVLFDKLQIGYDANFFGRVYLTGESTVMELDSGSTVGSSATVVVGRLGEGYLEVNDGAWLRLTSIGGDLVVGSDAAALGEMYVDGASLVDVRDDFVVGDSGVGFLTVTGEALVRTTESASDFIIGNVATGSGSVLVDGRFTRLQLAGDLFVGNLGIGELTVSNSALVDADATGSQATVGALGRVNLAGGTLDVLDVDVSGYLGGHGVVRGQVDVLAAGDVEVNTGQLLNFEDTVNNSGAITVTEGEVRFLDAATTSATGRLTLEDGVVRYSQAHTNNGVIASAAGTNNLHGAITNAAGATVVVASETIAVFNDSYTDAGTTTVLSRGNALFLANATFTSTALVALSLDAANGVNQVSQMSVAGDLDIQNASLALSFSPSFDLSTSQSIELIHTDGTLTGQFVPPIFPNVQGVNFGLVYSSSSVMLDILVDAVGGIPGDFNADGVVDAADYTVWRDGLGTTYSQADYTNWRNNYGQTSAGLPALSEQAPEPAGVALAALVAAAVGATRRRVTG